jgi:hypothetical protein
MATFKLNEEGLRRAVADGIRANVVPKVQVVLDEVYEAHTGKPVDEVKPALADAWASVGEGWTLTDPNLTAYAEAISEGRRIKVEVGPMT